MPTKYYAEYVATGNTKLQIEDDIFLNKLSGYTGIGVDPVTNLDVDGQIRLSNSATYNEGEIRYLSNRVWVNTGGTSTSWAPIRIGDASPGTVGSSGSSGTSGSSGVEGNNPSNSAEWYYLSGYTTHLDPGSTRFNVNVPFGEVMTRISVNITDIYLSSHYDWFKYLEDLIEISGHTASLQLVGYASNISYPESAASFIVTGVTNHTTYFELSGYEYGTHVGNLVNDKKYMIYWVINGRDGGYGSSGLSGTSNSSHGTSGSSGVSGTSGSAGGSGTSGSSGETGGSGVVGSSGSSGSGSPGSSGSSGSNDSSWTTWSPTITWGGSTPTNITSTYRYSFDDYTCHFIINLRIRNTSSTTTSAEITLPKTVTDTNIIIPVSCKISTGTPGEYGSAYIDASNNTPGNRNLNITSFSVSTTSTWFYVEGFYEWSS